MFTGFSWYNEDDSNNGYKKDTTYDLGKYSNTCINCKFYNTLHQWCTHLEDSFANKGTSDSCTYFSRVEENKCDENCYFCDKESTCTKKK